MTQVLPGQLTVVGEMGPGARSAEPQPAPPAMTESSPVAPGNGPGHASLEHLELILLELNLRAPAPAVGPSHWWG